MLTVEIKDADRILDGLTEVEIVCDEAGLAELRRQLGFLEGSPNHVHLATPSWSGTELNEEVQGNGNVLVHQLTIHKIK
jgi:hypothetical protein